MLSIYCERNQVWEIVISVPDATTVTYRYFVGNISNSSCSSSMNSQENVLITKWEAHWQSRSVIISEKATDKTVNDTFGLQGVEKPMIDDGWLTCEHEFRFSISSPKESPFLEVFEDHSDLKLSKSSFYVKTEASQLAFSSKLISISPYNFTETADLKEHKVLVPLTNHQIHHVFNVKTLDSRKEFVSFHIFTDNDRKLGTAVIGCGCLPKSKGIIKLPVVNDKHSVVAIIRVAYLHISPFKSDQSMEYCFTRHWKARPMLHVGHRGSGNSFTSQKLANVWENTLASFNQASKSGADFLEFDVHLTKDEVPIVYHDLTTCLIASAKKSISDTNNLVHLPVHNMNLKEVQALHVRHKSRGASRSLEFNEDNYDDAHQPFPTLKYILDNVPIHTGFNIEVKWPTLDDTKKYEDSMEHYFDANVFVDAILEVVFESVKARKIIFSCFDVDICIMLRRKQNRYPVLFLTNGDTLHYQPLLDLREATNAMAIGTAKAEGFLGIDTLDKDVYKTPDIVKKTHEAGLLFACYGDDVGDNLQKMKQAGVDIAIYDRIYENQNLPQRNGL